MKIISVQQGSDDWLKIRSAHDTASEAPAANGKSKYTTRTELMHQKHTPIMSTQTLIFPALLEI